MATDNVFKSLIEPTIVRIPVLEASHVERYQGREFVVSQTIQRNIFTEFDRKLSRHLTALRGAGFPAFTVSVRITERGGKAGGRTMGSTHHDSVPHALKVIAERACGENGKAELRINHSTPDDPARSGLLRQVESEMVASMEAALLICASVGEAGFLDVSGDFDVIMAKPPCDLKPIVANLQNGSAHVPCPTGEKITPFECPIYGFARHAASHVAAQSYLATARHALVNAKEDAVSAFRAAAEERILNFDRALNGRALEGHRLDAATQLVGRLKAGLGDTLSGISEDAKITALDWSEVIAESAAAASDEDTIIVPPMAAAS